MRRFNDIRTLITAVFSVPFIFLFWIFIALLENYYLTLLFPLYIGMLMGGLGTIKYRHRDIHALPYPILKKETLVFLVFLSIALGTVCFVTAFNYFTPEILIIFYILFTLLAVHTVLLFNHYRTESSIIHARF